MKPIALAPFVSLFLILAAVAFAVLAGPRGFDVLVPTKSPCEPEGERNRLWIAHVLTDDRVSLNGEVIPVPQLKQRLHQSFKDSLLRVLFVSAEPELDFKSVARVIDIAASEADRLALLTPSQRGTPADCYHLNTAPRGLIIDYVGNTKHIIDVKPVPWWPW